MASTLLSIPTDPKRLQALIERRHPEYKEKVEHWDFLYETYLGKREWFAKNIFKFNREGSETYSDRLKRAYRFNHTREVVDLVNKYLFKNPAMRKEDTNPVLQQFRQCATMSGLSLQDFERQAGRMASIFGRVYAVVDNTFKGQEDGVVSVADQKQSGGKLYAYLVLPHEFLDCGYDDLGHFEWVLIRENYREDDDPFESSGEVTARYRLWTKTSWALFGVDGKGNATHLDSGDHNLGVVPVVKCDHIESDEKYSVPALIEDIAYLDRAIANYLSNLDQIINDQTFSQLIMPAQGVLRHTGTDSVFDDDAAIEAQQRRVQKLGTSQILLFDGEQGVAPSYISPDPRQARLIVETISKIINEIYHTVGLAGERTKQDNAVGIDNSSGVAKAYDFERVNALLTAKAAAMQAFANRLETLACIYGGEDLTMDDRGPDTVLYPTNFDVRNLVSELSIAQELALVNAPIEVRRLQMKGVVSKLWPLLDDAKTKKLEQAIDAWEDSPHNSVIADLSHNPSLQEPAAGQGAVGGKEAVEKIG